MLSPEGLTMAPYKSPDHSKDWPIPMKSQGYLIFPQLHQLSTVTSFMDILKSQFHLHVLPTRVPLGISLMSDISTFEALKKKGFQPQALVLTHWILDTQNYSQELMPLTMHSPTVPFKHNSWWLVAPNFIPLPDLFHLDSIQWSHDKELLAILKAFKMDGDITSEGLWLPIDVGHQSLDLQDF